ncbi:mitochondrial carrier domain-containing protein, partial [Baffinella frigidus]
MVMASAPPPYSRHWTNAVAGLSGGFVSSMAMHPLDVITTRFQVHTGGSMSRVPKYRSTLHALTTIVRQEGAGALYAGLVPNLVGSTLSWGCYFYGYSFLRSHAVTYLEEAAQEERGRRGGGEE